MFNTLQSEKEKFNRQKISKDIAELKNTINQLDIMTSIDYFIPEQQNSHSSKAHFDYSPR